MKIYFYTIDNISTSCLIPLKTFINFCNFDISKFLIKALSEPRLVRNTWNGKINDYNNILFGSIPAYDEGKIKIMPYIVFQEKEGGAYYISSSTQIRILDNRWSNTSHNYTPDIIIQKVYEAVDLTFDILNKLKEKNDNIITSISNCTPIANPINKVPIINPMNPIILPYTTKLEMQSDINTEKFNTLV